jgi:hypothetical protein
MQATNSSIIKAFPISRYCQIIALLKDLNPIEIISYLMENICISKGVNSQTFYFFIQLILHINLANAALQRYFIGNSQESSLRILYNLRIIFQR